MLHRDEREDQAINELERLKPHDHVCLIHESPEGQVPELVVPFLELGVNRGEKCLFILEALRSDDVRRHLQTAGMDVSALESSGQLVFHETETYTKRPSFDHSRVLAGLIAETQKAIDDGYPALRVTDDMSWALPGRPGSEKVLAYEAKLNRDFFPRYPCLVLCQYHRGRFDAEILKGALATHPLVARQDRVYHNSYYLSPEELMGEKPTQSELEHRLKALERERQYQDRVKAMQEALEDMLRAFEARDPYSSGHQERVTRLACAIAEQMGLSEAQVDVIAQAGKVHDIGKMFVGTDVLTKPGRLTEMELAEIKAHPRAGFDLLDKMGFPYPVLQIVLQHHERLDGSGYPQGLSGDEILVEARVLAVADVVEAMCYDRSYREALGVAATLLELSWKKGVLYDAEVVEACSRLFTKKGFKFE